ncbi:MAG: hypothetical protein IKJ19_05585 [Clostridia bacterium]|nr:hypothetical protein [Clostridia bacterium]
MRVTKKAYAKVNLALNVFNKNDSGYHELDSLVVTVDLFDKITLISRKDKKVNLKVLGFTGYANTFVKEKDNAYKAALAYMKECDCNGVDIILKKNIPLSSGMGGSSACASATLLAMEELYGCGANLEKIANTLGSDTAYLLKGGYARLKGRGEQITPLKLEKSLQMLAVFPSSGVDTTECFKQFDKMPKMAVNSNIDALIYSFSEEEILYSECKNGLTDSACAINGELKECIDYAKSLSPKACFMTGSGATVIVMFESKELLLWAQEKFYNEGFKCKILNTYIPERD